MKIGLIVSLLALALAGAGCKPKTLKSNKRAGDPTTEAGADGAQALASPGDQGGTILAPGSTASLTVSGPATLSPGTCSPALTITSVDNSGNLAAISATDSPMLAAGGGRLQFYSDAACTKQLPGLVFPGKTASLTLYAMDPQTEALSVVFTIGDFAAPALTLAVQ